MLYNDFRAVAQVLGDRNFFLKKMRVNKSHLGFSDGNCRNSMLKNVYLSMWNPPALNASYHEVLLPIY